MKASNTLFKNGFVGLFAALLGLLSISTAHAQIFTTGSLASNGSNIENTGTILDAINFYDPVYGIYGNLPAASNPNNPSNGGTPNPTLNGVAFTGEAYNASLPGYTLTLTGPNVGIDDNRAGGVLSTDAIYPLVFSGVYSYYSSTPYAHLSVNDLTPGKTYSLQLFFDSEAGDTRSLFATDGSASSSTVTTPGPQFITDQFTATSSSETVALTYTATLPVELSGFVLTTTEAAPEPSTWTMLLSGAGLLAFWRIRTRCVRP